MTQIESQKMMRITTQIVTITGIDIGTEADPVEVLSRKYLETKMENTQYKHQLNELNEKLAQIENKTKENKETTERLEAELKIYEQEIAAIRQSTNILKAVIIKNYLCTINIYNM